MATHHACPQSLGEACVDSRAHPHPHPAATHARQDLPSLRTARPPTCPVRSFWLRGLLPQSRRGHRGHGQNVLGFA